MRCNSWTDENLIRDIIVAVKPVLRRQTLFRAVYFSIIKIVAV